MERNSKKRDEMIKVYQDTKGIVESLEIEDSSTNKFKFEDIKKDITEDKKVVTLPTKSKNKFQIPEAKFKNKGIMSVVSSDTISTVLNQKGKVCMINMASPKRPGGGVENGSTAQEECIFRCSSLYQTMSKDFYPLDLNEVLYTENAVIVKDFNYQKLETPIKVDCITIAAFKLRNGKTSENIKNYEEVMKDKIRLMLSIPHNHGIKTLILGAWGCGVYNNDPNRVSQFFKEILINENFRYLYDKIIFGVINDHNSVDNNYEIFNKKLNNS